MSDEIQDKCVNCKTCGKALWRGNKYGYCRSHISPEARANMTAGLRRKMQSDPEYMQRVIALARANVARPEHRQKLTEAAKQSGAWRKALAATTPESYQLAATRAAETKLSWCPPEYRAEYRRLKDTKRMRAHEAKAIILAQHEKDMAEFRRKLGA